MTGDDLSAILIAVRNDVMIGDSTQAGAVGAFGAYGSLLLWFAVPDGAAAEH